MELHAVWNRIDQLEQLIITQAKEIDLLRRVVCSTQQILHTNGLGAQVENVNINYKNLSKSAALPSVTDRLYLQNKSSKRSTKKNWPPLMGNFREPSLSPPPHSYNPTTATSDYYSNNNIAHQVRNSTPPTYKNYLMNPIVHPANAIPPVANSIVLRSTTSTILHQQHHSHLGGYSNKSKTKSLYFKEPTTQLNVDMEPAYNNQNNKNRPTLTTMTTNQTSQTLPAASSPARWSTGVSLLADTQARNELTSAQSRSQSSVQGVSFPGEELRIQAQQQQMNEQMAEAAAATSRAGMNRFSLIELLTCFCPCFSMC